MARLLILAHRVPFPPNKGEKLRTFHQIEELVSQGHDVTVLAPFEVEADLNDAAALSKKFNINVVCKQLPNKIYRLALAVLTNRSFSETNFYSKALATEFSKLSSNADTILLTASSLANYVLSLNVLPKAQLLMDFMDVDSEKWRQYAQESSPLKKAIYSREASKIEQLEREVSQHFSIAYVISATEKQLFESTIINTGNLKVLGNGIDQSLFNPSNNKVSETTNFLFSGVMDYKPNIDAMLWFVKHCWPSIVERVPHAHLIIAGMNPSSEIAKLALLPNIEVTGFVDDIKPYFDKAHVFIAPFQIARGVQNKVLQAMACALAVVTTPLGAEGIICENNEDIVLANSVESFTQQCVELAHDGTRRTQIGNKALQTIDIHYGWKSVLQPLTEAVSVS